MAAVDSVGCLKQQFVTYYLSSFNDQIKIKNKLLKINIYFQVMYVLFVDLDSLPWTLKSHNENDDDDDSNYNLLAFPSLLYGIQNLSFISSLPQIWNGLIPR